MKFKSSRTVVLSGMGHHLVFTKGQTLFVPPVLHTHAMTEGLEAVPDQGETAPEAAQPVDDTARIEAIKQAMRQIAERNNSDDFDGSGTPKVRAIENLTGGVKPVDNKERQALWGEVVASVGT